MPINVLILVACGVLYYRIGQHDYGQGFFTAGISVALSLITAFGLSWGWLGQVVVQAGLLGALTAYNMRRQDRAAP
ncbi:MAG: hypothetical protein WBC97_06835 [Gemmatimonadales bacterium]